MSNKFNKKIRQYMLIILLGILSAFNFVIFVVNNKFAPSGINGIATMLQYKLGFSLGYFSLLVNIPLCILAFIFVSKGFALKSFTFTLVYSISYLIFQNIDFSSIAYNADGVDVIIPVLAAAIVNGFIYGSTFKMNASTGGTDIIAKLISKIKPEFNFIWVTFALNVVVASVSFFVYGEVNSVGKVHYDLKPVILCIMYSFISSRIGNSMLQDTKSAVKFEIITPYGKEISEEIFKELHHGVTNTKVIGMYSHEEKNLLTCVVNKHQMNEFQEIINKYPNTFAYISKVSGIIGNFKKISK